MCVNGEADVYGDFAVCDCECREALERYESELESDVPREAWRTVSTPVISTHVRDFSCHGTIIRCDSSEHKAHTAERFANGERWLHDNNTSPA